MDLVVVDFVDTDQSNHRVGMDLVLTMTRNGRRLTGHNLVGILVLEILMVDTLMVMVDTLMVMVGT